MADVFGLSDVASPDTGRGGSTNLKTGGMRRKYNMKHKGKMKKCPAGKMYDMKLKKCVTRKGDLNKDGKMSSYESKRSSAIQKSMKRGM
jgi:hypothetical protein|tara:strand:- start:147 stop:413 length:267 start_codon:yes stop_codon:yes gene_type:complete